MRHLDGSIGHDIDKVKGAGRKSCKSIAEHKGGAVEIERRDAVRNIHDDGTRHAAYDLGFDHGLIVIPGTPIAQESNYWHRAVLLFCFFRFGVKISISYGGVGYFDTFGH